MPNPKTFSTLPHVPTIPLSEYTVAVPEPKLNELKDDLKNARPIKATFESVNPPHNVGVTKRWMDEAVSYWREKFDWRKVEQELNQYANYLAHLSRGDDKLDLHFIALFSEDSNAVPVVMTHGWPGSVLEFLPLLHHLTTTYTPSTLPVHLIVPSIPGFGFSSPPPLESEWSNFDTAVMLDQVMRGLGFEGYVAQGGDIGSLVSRLLGQNFEACKAVHLNFLSVPKPETFDNSTLSQADQALVERAAWFLEWEFAYRNEHATKTSTIGITVASSPIALLAWIGEKFLVWSDTDPTLDQILADVSLYYLTDTFPTSLYHYRTTAGPHPVKGADVTGLRGKPLGYSLFPKEIVPAPIEWIKADGNYDVTWHRAHDKGGHFAALEQPVELWQDVEAFIKESWRG